MYLRTTPDIARMCAYVMILSIGCVLLHTPCGHAYTPPFLFRDHHRSGAFYEEAVKKHESLRMLHGLNSDGITEHRYEQFIDHSNTAEGTFAQRYWMDSTFNHTGTDIAFLYINGESTGSAMDGYAALLARDLKALVFSLEHRFYGESMPYALTDTAHLKHLTVDNALADLSTFAKYAETTLIGRPLRWVCVGGSYAGALSAWLKARYPEQFVAAWSSSGVVHAKLDFSDYDGHIVSVLPTDCLRKTRTVFRLWEKYYNDPSTRQMVLDLFKTPAYFTGPEMAFAVTDSVSGMVQYGMKSKWCSMISATEDADELLRILAEFGHDQWGADAFSSCSDSTYCMTNKDMSSKWGPSGYAWVYQTCAELAYWQVGYPNSLRPELIDSEFFMNQCRAVFRPDIFPDTFAFNERHGGYHPPADHVIALQGSDDPWMSVGVTKSLSDTYLAFVAHCDDCGHCGDLGFPRDEEPENLQRQRNFIRQVLFQWLQVV